MKFWRRAAAGLAAAALWAAVSSAHAAAACPGESWRGIEARLPYDVAATPVDRDLAALIVRLYNETQPPDEIIKPAVTMRVHRRDIGRELFVFLDRTLCVVGWFTAAVHQGSDL